MFDRTCLARRCELKGSQSGLHVGGVGFQVIDGIGDAGLQLRRMLARRAVGRDLVEMGHFGNVKLEGAFERDLSCRSRK